MASTKTTRAGSRATKTTKTPRTAGRGPHRGRRRRSRRRVRIGLPALTQGRRDLLGLAAIALGVFLAFVQWGDWSGGLVGERLQDALAWAVGAVRLGVPVALVLGGAALLLRPALPALAPLRAGTLCLFAAITLALAAGTFGLGPQGVPAGSWDGASLRARGGVLGQAQYSVTHGLFSNVGTAIIAIFLLIAGVLALTGASVGAVVHASGSSLAGRMRALSARRERRLAARSARAKPARVTPPEPQPEELVVRQTHVEGPPQDAPQRPPRSRGPLTFDPFAPEPDPFETDAPQAAPALPANEATPAENEPADAIAEGEADAEASGPEGSAPAPPALTPQGRFRRSVTDDPAFHWRLPAATQILARSTAEQSRPDSAGQGRVAASLVEALGHFGVEAKVVGTVAGPHITRYELRLAPGTKVAKVAALKDDLAYALAATDIRILAPIPGKQAVGVEVPNAKRRIVRLGDVFQEPPADWSPLTVWLGKDVAGKAIGADLARMPHLLVAGTTGSGKSGAINAMLASILLRASPHEVRLVLVDPKQVELNHYESIPHLLTPVITDPRMAANALANLVREMEQRYSLMSLARTRGLVDLNRTRAERGDAPLPYILCVIDELADLMMVAPADVEDSIIRLAQKARAVGIHLLLATQSPRVDVITGMIKANVPSRIAFAVSSQTDSRVILDQNGAESLLGQGDMLFSPVGSSRLQRIQGAYIDEAQILRLTDMWRVQGEPELREELLAQVEREDDGEGGDGELDPDSDPLLADAIVLVAEMQTASTSMLQRRLRLGYTRAGRLIDMLERRGIISGYEGSKPRQVLISEGDVPRMLASLEQRASPAPPRSAGPPAASGEDPVGPVAEAPIGEPADRDGPPDVGATS